MIRRIICNIDCESRWSGERLPPRVLQRVCEAGTALMVLGADELWTPTAVTMPPTAHDPIVFRTGPLDRLPPADVSLLWAGDDRIDAGPRPEAATSFASRVWAAPVPMGAAAKAANDKTLAFRIRCNLDCNIEDTTIVDDVDAIPRAPLWVLKGRFGVSGRGRILGRDAITEAQRSYAKRLIAPHAIWEPWVERTVDFGATAFVSQVGLTDAAFHRAFTDNTGAFRGIDTDLADALTTDELHDAEAALQAAADALSDIGYRGPFGVDGFVYRDARGHRRLQPLSEINARLTFGFAARAIADRWGHGIRFELGTGGPWSVVG